MNNPSKALIYFNESLSIYRANYGPDHEKLKSVENDIAKLANKQPTIMGNVEFVKEDISDERQTTTTSSVQPVDENTNDEQLINVIIDSDTPPTTVEPPSPSVNDSSSTLKSERSKTKTEAKTLGKRKICQNCVIL